jgi:hypothetical protein
MTIQRDLVTGLTAGSTGTGYLRYNGATKAAGQFDGGATAPTNTTRLNYDGNFYATNFYGVHVGNVTGNVTGNCSGSSGSCTGNAATATTCTGNAASATTAAACTGDAASVDGKSFGTFTAAGGIAYATSTTALAAIGAGTAGQVLKSGGAGAPTWGAVDSLSTASGSAPSYAARAWVNFNGTGTAAIRASGNVSSITDHGTGEYTVNFTTAMQDANYCVATGSSRELADPAYPSGTTLGIIATPTASSCRFKNSQYSGTYDALYGWLSFFR